MIARTLKTIFEFTDASLPVKCSWLRTRRDVRPRPRLDQRASFASHIRRPAVKPKKIAVKWFYRVAAYFISYTRWLHCVLAPEVTQRHPIKPTTRIYWFCYTLLSKATLSSNKISAYKLVRDPRVFFTALDKYTKWNYV